MNTVIERSVKQCSDLADSDESTAYMNSMLSKNE